MTTRNGTLDDTVRTGTDPDAVAAPGRVPPLAVLVRAAAIGLATGARSTSATAALVLTTTSSDPAPLDRVASVSARIVAGVAAAGELVADKLPVAPPRTDLTGLLPRLLLAPVAAAAADRRDGAGPDVWTALDALVATAAAAASAVGGVRLRAALQRRLGSDLPGAIGEDVLAATLAWVGSRRAPGPRATPGT
ncbi:MAG: hypothetical protein EKK42_13330 [Pseudonocardiaceae bacterium]|nr:MAG: hypothetical protein EKK42_13330 [Pseudonocardiaceae bacterium]